MNVLNNTQQVSEDTLSESNQEVVETQEETQEETTSSKATSTTEEIISPSEARNAFFNQTDEEDIDKVISQMKNEAYQPQTNLGKEDSKDGLRQEEMQERRKGQISKNSEEAEDKQEDEPKQDVEAKSSEDEAKEDAPKRRHKIKAQGKEYDFSLDDLKQLASKGIDYTNKMKRISPYRKMISAIEEEGITEAEINQFIEMRKGNKDAIGAFTKKHNIALSDIEEGESNADSYRPNNYGREQTALNDVDADLRASMQTQHYDKMVNWVNKQLDADSQQFFIENPEALRLLARDIESGGFDQVLYEIERADLLDYYKPTVSTMQKYIDISQKMVQKQNSNNQNNATIGRNVQNQPVSSPKVDKTKLGVTGTQSSQAPKKKPVTSMFDKDFDESYEQFYKKAMGYTPSY